MDSVLGAVLRLNCYDVGRAGLFGADYRFISTLFGGMPSACVVLVVTGVFLLFSFGEISRTVGQFGVQLAINAVVASVIIVPVAFVLLYVPLRISALFAVCYGAIGILSAPALAFSGFWPVNIFTTLDFVDPGQIAYLSAWTITTLAYWAALPLFFVVARFGVRSLFSSHRTHAAIRTPLPKPWRPLSVLRYIFGVHAAYGWNWSLLLARAFFAAGLVCFFYSLYAAANKLGMLTEPCYFDESGQTIGLRQVQARFHGCLLGVENLMGRSLLVLLNAGMGVLVGIAGVFIGRELYRSFLTQRYNAYSEYDGDILFLRPFNEDAKTFRDNVTSSRWAFFDLVDQAENFARLLDQTVSEFGRTVAVGSPTRRSTGGLTLEEVSLPWEEWQSSVRSMAEAADAVVFVDGEGEGIAWERNMLLDGQHVRKTLFLIGTSGNWRSIREIVRLAGCEDDLVSRKIGLLSRRHIPIGIHVGSDTLRLYYSKTFQMSAYHVAIMDFCNHSGLRAGTRLRSESRPRFGPSLNGTFDVLDGMNSNDQVEVVEGDSYGYDDIERRAQLYHDQIDAQIEASYRFLRETFGEGEAGNFTRRYSLRTLSVFAVHIATLVAIARDFPQLDRAALNGFTRTLSFRTENTMPDVEPPAGTFVSYCGVEESFMHRQTGVFSKQGVEALVQSLLQELGGKNCDYDSISAHIEHLARQASKTYLPHLSEE